MNTNCIHRENVSRVVDIFIFYSLSWLFLKNSIIFYYRRVLIWKSLPLWRISKWAIWLVVRGVFMADVRWRKDGQVVVERGGAAGFITHPDTAVEMGYTVPGYSKKPKYRSDTGASPDWKSGSFPAKTYDDVAYWVRYLSPPGPRTSREWASWCMQKTTHNSLCF